jgi:UDP-N-acetylmuramyl pentapeptide synthase
MRMTRQDVGGVAVYNDAYNANPDAVLAALRAFAELAGGAARRVTVLGDMLELGEESGALHAEVGRDVVLLADCCLDEYTSHGHCGVLDAEVINSPFGSEGKDAHPAAIAPPKAHHLNDTN